VRSDLATPLALLREIEKMRLAITGATGTVGSVLVQHALQAGHEVRAADPRYQPGFPVPLTVSNLLDKTVLCRFLEGCDAVIHLANAWHAHTPDPVRVLCEATEMNAKLFGAAVEVGVKRIVFASSIQVCAGTGSFEDTRWPVQKQIVYLPMDGSLPARPANAYSLFKHTAEVTLEYLCQRQGVTGIALRYPAIYSESHMKKITNLFRKGNLWVGHTPMVLQEGCAFLTVADAVRLTLACVTADLSGYHCLLPTTTWHWPAPVRNLITQYFQGVELRRPIDQIDNLVDLAIVTQKTGWTPLDRPFLL
jgi:nucleoside-diphosphate-sugar epimerase